MLAGRATDRPDRTMTFVWGSGWVASGTDGSQTRGYPGKEIRLPSSTARTEEPERSLTASVGHDIRLGFGLALALLSALIVLVAIAITVPATAFVPGAAPVTLGIALLVTTLIGIELIVLARRSSSQLAVAEEAQNELREAYDRARLDSLLDALTGLGNHRAFQEELDARIARAREDETNLALLMIDVDDLKKVNDQRGHAAGDELLRS